MFVKTWLIHSKEDEHTLKPGGYWQGENITARRIHISSNMPIYSVGNTCSRPRCNASFCN